MRSSAEDRRRGWCPGVARPMETGDGLLVRVHPAGGTLTAAALRSLAEAARLWGNGLVDVTSRANLQVRGVRPATHAPLADALTDAGLGDPRPGEGPQRLTLAAPLAGLDPADPLDLRALAAAIEVVGVTGLPPKTLVAVEGALRLDGVEADLRVAALSRESVALGLVRTGGTQWIGTATPVATPALVRAVLAAFAAHRGTARRVRDLDVRDRERVVEAAMAAGLGPVRIPEPGRPLEPRPVMLGEGRTALILELPFGRADAETLAVLADRAERHGDGLVRLTHRRGVALAGLDLDGAAAVAATARNLGLILFPSDPRRGVAACPGAPACARGTTPTHADAARLALPAAGLGVEVHVSGCAKGCARPRATALTLVGDEGRYRVVLDGRADGPPVARRDLPAILDALARADHPSRLAGLLGAETP